MKQFTYEYHRFLDEAGDTTFYGKGQLPILGINGVSNYFMICSLAFHEPLNDIRLRFEKLKLETLENIYYQGVPSFEKRKEKFFFFHAKDDIPEIRKAIFDFILSIECTCNVVIAHKKIDVFVKKHHNREAEFYADLLSHLLVRDLEKPHKIVLKVSQRKQATSHKNLEFALENAQKKKNRAANNDIVFDVQNPQTESLLSLVDYFAWAIQRKFERKEDRFFNYIASKIGVIEQLYE